MKIAQILYEMSWPDKFAALEQQIQQTPDMTMQQMFDVLEQQYNVYPQVQYDQMLSPNSIGGGGMSIQTIGELDPSAPPELHHMKILHIVLSPDVGEHTPVNEVPGIIDLLMHELAHARQPPDFIKNKTYHQPSRGQDLVQDAKYILQPIERAPQVMSATRALAALDLTPSDLETIVKHVSSTLQERNFNVSMVDIQNIAAGEIARAKGAHNVDVLNVQQVSDLFDKQSLKHAVQQIVFVASLLAIVEQATGTPEAQRVRYSIDNPNDRTSAYKVYKRIVHSFKKQLYKQYPKVRAYWKAHRPQNEEDIEMTLRANMQQWKRAMSEIAHIFGFSYD